MLKLTNRALILTTVTALTAGLPAGAAPGTSGSPRGTVVTKEQEDTDTLKITKVSYDAETNMLRVLATSSFGFSSILTLLIDGSTDYLPMHYNPSIKRYELVRPSPDTDIRGKQVTISSNKGGPDSAVVN